MKTLLSTPARHKFSFIVSHLRQLFEKVVISLNRINTGEKKGMKVVGKLKLLFSNIFVYICTYIGKRPILTKIYRNERRRRTLHGTKVKLIKKKEKEKNT